jgi:hypothetical protein
MVHRERNSSWPGRRSLPCGRHLPCSAIAARGEGQAGSSPAGPTPARCPYPKVRRHRDRAQDHRRALLDRPDTRTIDRCARASGPAYYPPQPAARDRTMEYLSPEFQSASHGDHADEQYGVPDRLTSLTCRPDQIDIARCERAVHDAHGEQDAICRAQVGKTHSTKESA